MPKFNFPAVFRSGNDQLLNAHFVQAVVEKTMDSGIQDVLDIYHAMIETEHNSPRELPPGGRDGGQDQRLRAVGPETGQFINCLLYTSPSPRDGAP